MKRLLIILGSIFLGLIVCAAVVVGYAALRGTKLDASSKAYVDTNIPIILSTWSEDELKQRSSTELLHAATDEKLDHMFSTLKELGALQHYEGSKGESHMSLTTQSGEIITADYVASAMFQNSTATIKVRLIQRDDQWQILDFYVQSPMFQK